MRRRNAWTPPDSIPDKYRYYGARAKAVTRLQHSEELPLIVASALRTRLLSTAGFRRALTQPHQIEEWLMKNDFKPTVGHHFKPCSFPGYGCGRAISFGGRFEKSG
jgi:hypothetical protein